MKILNTVTAAILFLIFFVWAFYGDYANAVLFYVPYLPMYFLVTLVILSHKKVKRSIEPVFKFITEKAFIIFPVLAFIYALAFNIFVLSGKPHVQDEINMFFQAQAMLKGEITRPLHPHYEFFRFLYIIPSKSGSYSLYQPGFSLLLAPFLYLGIQNIVNPLLTAGAVYLLGINTHKLFDRETAALSMALAVASVFLMPMGGTYMNHSLCALSSLTSMWFIQKSFDKKPFKNIVFASLAIVVIMFTRPQLAPFILISGLLFIFLRQGFKTFFLKMAISGLTILPFFILILFSESLFTGSMLIPKHVAYFSYSEPFNKVLGLGLYKGCRTNTIIPLPPEGLTISHAVYITYLRLVQLVYGMFFHPIFFIYLPLLFILKKKGSELKNEYILLQYFLVTFIAYFFYSFDGNVYGPRYYYETSFFLVPLFARGIILTTKITPHYIKKHLQPRILVYSFILSGFIFHYAVTAPYLFKLHQNAFWGMDPNLSELLEKEDITNALVFISPYEYISTGAAVMDLTDIDSNDVIYAVDLGKEANQRLINYYKDRDVYQAEFNRPWIKEKSFEFKKVQKVSEQENFTIEMEHKLYPVDGIPDYCNKFPAWPYIDFYSGFLLPPEMLDEVYFFCRFKSLDQHYEFGQNVKKAGKYKVEIKTVSGPLSRRFLLTVGNQKKIINFYSKDYTYKNIPIELDFTKGFNYFKLQPLDIREGGNYFIIDKLEFTPL